MEKLYHESVIPAKEFKIPLLPEHWDFQEGKVEFLNYKGVNAVKMDQKSGYMIYKDLDFTNGTIEFDVEVDRPMPFPTIYYRWKNEGESEHVYLRTGVAGNREAVDAVQYASIVHGVNLWDLQYEFQSAADIKINQWNHVKLVVSGKQLRVYVNSDSVPNLEIPAMEGNTQSGKIGLGTGFPGQAIFANLIVRPDDTENLPAVPAPDLTRHDTRYLRHWQVTAPDSLPPGQELTAYRLPDSVTNWQGIQAERRGLVNLSRKFGGSRQRHYVWLKARIQSDMPQKKTIRMGFSDEIWVFLNRQPVYVDKNIYYLNMRKNPDGRISIDNCSFEIPLKEGMNELVVGVANDFYGWGLIARLESLDGIEIDMN